MAIINVPSPVQILFVDRLLKGDKGDTGTGGTGTEAVAFHESLYDHGDIHTHSNKGSLDQISVGSLNELFINGINYAEILTNYGVSFLPVLSWLPADSAVVVQTPLCGAAKANTTKIQIEYKLHISIAETTPLSIQGYLMRGSAILKTHLGYAVEDLSGPVSWDLDMSGTVFLTDYANETVYLIFSVATTADITLVDDAYVRLTAMQ